MAELVHLDDARIARLMAGELSPDELQTLEDHVDECPACSELLVRVAQQVAPPEPAEVGTRKVGRYELSHQLGAGGMGVVYAAFDPNLRRDVALKLVKPNSGDADADEQRKQRLLREAHALAALSHPNIVTVFDAGVVDDQLFIATELIKGRTVTQWVADQAPGLEEIVEVYRQVGAALAAAHAEGIVHRDVKPDNILIGDDGRVRLVDFGLATEGGARQTVRALASTVTIKRDDEGGDGDGEVRFARGSNDPLTVTGAVMGTPVYMAPEQLLGPTSDPRADQFAFCVSLYESRYRKRPFAGNTMVDLAENVLAGRVRDVELATPAAERLHAVIMRGLATEPDARFASMDALLAALEGVLAEPAEPGGTRGGLLWAAVVVGVVALAVGAVVMMRGGGERGSAGAGVGGSASDSGSVGASGSGSVDASGSASTSGGVDASLGTDAGGGATATRLHRPPLPAQAGGGLGRGAPTSRPARPRKTPPKRVATAASTAASTAAMTKAVSHISRATRMISARNPACRAELKKAWATGAKPVFDPRLVNARCDMVAGNCARGIAAARKFLEAKGTGAVAAQADAEREGRMFCSTSKGTWQQRLARLSTQVFVARTSARVAKRFLRDLHAIARNRGSMTRSHKIAVYNLARTLAQALARFSDCAGARDVLRLATDLYLGPGRPINLGPVPPTAALKTCLGTPP